MKNPTYLQSLLDGIVTNELVPMEGASKPTWERVFNHATRYGATLTCSVKLRDYYLNHTPLKAIEDDVTRTQATQSIMTRERDYSLGSHYPLGQFIHYQHLGLRLTHEEVFIPVEKQVLTNSDESIAIMKFSIELIKQAYTDLTTADAFTQIATKAGYNGTLSTDEHLAITMAYLKPAVAALDETSKRPDLSTTVHQVSLRMYYLLAQDPTLTVFGALAAVSEEVSAAENFMTHSNKFSQAEFCLNALANLQIHIQELRSNCHNDDMLRGYIDKIDQDVLAPAHTLLKQQIADNKIDPRQLQKQLKTNMKDVTNVFKQQNSAYASSIDIIAKGFYLLLNAFGISYADTIAKIRERETRQKSISDYASDIQGQLPTLIMVR